MSDMRTAITNAMAAGTIETPAPAPAAAPAAPAATPTTPSTPAPAPVPAVARDEAGRFAGRAEPKPAETAPPAAEKPASAATAPKYRPPQSWKPVVREKWATLPEDVQEEIDRVERAAADRIRKAGEAEKGYGALRQALTPYEAHLRASGKAVPEALGDALKLFTSLRSGSPQERASALANLINEAEQAGVGLDSINAILSQAPAQSAAQAKPQEFRDPRFDQFMQAMQTRERARVSQTITDFAAKHEFFADVQDDIAGLMEAGIAKDLQTAYDYAVALPKHREIGAVLEQRKAAEAARTGNEATERAKQAASSPRASPVSGAGPAPSKLRDIIASHM